MDENVKTICELIKENERMKAALSYLKFKGDHVAGHDVHMALALAGMDEKDIKVITFDNCEDMAYES